MKLTPLQRLKASGAPDAAIVTLLSFLGLVALSALLGGRDIGGFRAPDLPYAPIPSLVAVALLVLAFIPFLTEKAPSDLDHLEDLVLKSLYEGVFAKHPGDMVSTKGLG